MAKAVIFSKVYRAEFSAALSKLQAEKILVDFLNSVAEPLAHNQIILGHLKMVAKVPETQEFLFLSLTRLDQTDVKKSNDWTCSEANEIRLMDIDLNVLVFKHSRVKVEMVVQSALRKLLRQSQGRLTDRSG